MMRKETASASGGVSLARAPVIILACVLLHACGEGMLGKPLTDQTGIYAEHSIDPRLPRDPEDGRPQGSPGGQDGCDGACEDGQYNSCTCGAGDPCGWRNDGHCDQACEQVLPSAAFDDGDDCCADECEAGEYTTCTCRPEDPCNWSRDGHCDSACQNILPDDWFDDSTDCGTAGSSPDATPCDGACDEGVRNECTCGADDPCRWARNGVCDDACRSVSSTRFDDAVDCGSETSPDDEVRRYVVSAVYDNLDANDLNLMANGLEQLGYQRLALNRNVSAEELTGYLRNQAVETLYHTGHGFADGVATSTTMVTSGGTAVAARNVIFATCLTLKERNWMNSMGPTAQSLLGYTETSLDRVDDDVVRSFLDALGNGRTHLQAWFLANSRIASLADRWLGYVREGSGVVEISARQGDRPAAAPFGSFVELGEQRGVWLARTVLDDTREHQPAARGAVWVTPREVRTSVVPGALSGLVATTHSQSEAVALATDWLRAQGLLFPDAVLDRVVGVIRRPDGASVPQVVGHVVRFVRQLHGLPVRSNSVEHHIAVLVDATQVVASSLFWPEITLDPSPLPTEVSLLPAGDAAFLAADAISVARKGEDVHFVTIEPAYGSVGQYGEELVPAYLLRSVEGLSVVVDAATGQPLAAATPY